MAHLTPRQYAFVAAKVAGLSHAAAAQAAGYSATSRNSLAVTGCRLAARPEIAAAIAEGPRTLLGHGLTSAIHTLAKVAADPTHPDQVRANVAILELAHQHNLEATSP